MTGAPELPSVTCVIPVRDGERFIAEAIESALAQTHPPLEVLVGDDGSRDRSAEVAEGFGPPVRVLRQEPSGPVAARNLCIRAARGDLIAFLDCDDLWEPPKLERQARWLLSRPEADVVLSHVRVLREGPGTAADRRQRLGTFVWSTGLFRARAFQRFGLLAQEHQRAGALSWFIAARGRGLVSGVLDEPLVRRRLHDSNLSYEAEECMDEILSVLKADLERRRGAGR